jgi:CRISPR-associated protein Csb2
MALAASFFESGAEPAERLALEWLESQPPPALRFTEAEARSEVRVYVPVNDKAGGIVDRPRQDRTFPRVRPDDDTVYLVWRQGDPPEEIRHSLEQLCLKVTRIGHSSSLVQVWIPPSGENPEPNWNPEDGSPTHRLRTAQTGTLMQLESDFNSAEFNAYFELEERMSASKGTEQKRLKKEMAERFPFGPPVSQRPRLSSWQGYSKIREDERPEPALGGPFDPDITILTQLEGCALGLESTLQLTAALRRVTMGPSPKVSPEWITGHQPSGEPSRSPHVAFFPLPFVGFPHADGHVMGLGIAVPRDIEPSELQRYLGPLFFDADGTERLIQIDRRGEWSWTLQREIRQRPPRTLQVSTWTRPSMIWASVTPVVLHHHPKKRQGDLERILRDAFNSALLPEPKRIRVLGGSLFEGGGQSLDLPPFDEGGESMCKYQTHVYAEFDRPVKGPILLGRGRFRGYGLFRPVDKDQVLPWQF